jgi:DNA-directed RNA polymerase subunit RPC12/RpoP
VVYFFGKGDNKWRRSRQKEAMMKGEGLEEGWSGLSDEIMKRVAEWREQHPRATFREIEEEIDQRLSGLRAKMLSDTANRSDKAEWAGEEAGQVCPDCGAKIIKKGRKKRILLTRDGREVVLDREYAVCPACGQGIFPPG